MTEEHKASRTIVKSPPELWAECSVAQSLARHLGEFGEIRITRLEPETTVAWEGEHASGTVRLEPSGWGTQVTLTATPASVPEPEVAPEPEVVPEAQLAGEPEGAEDPVGEKDEEAPGEGDRLPRWQVFARLWARLGRKSSEAEEPEEGSGEDDSSEDDVVAGEDEPVALQKPVEAVQQPVEAAEETVEEVARPVPDLDHRALLVGALDSLGQAHHRPFSRA